MAGTAMEVMDPVVRALCECNVLVEDADHRESITPLHRAVALGQIEVLGALREDVNTQDVCGLTPLHYAVMFGSVDAVRDLLQLGAKPNVPDVMRNGYTPLHMTCKAANLDMVKLLLACKGVDVDQASARHGTALHLALRSWSLPVATMLVGVAGADVNATDSKLQRPLHLLALNTRMDIPKDGCDKLLDLLAEGDLQIDAADYRGRTPLHCAALTGNKGVVDALIARKANVNARDNIMRTPLHYAVLGLAVGADSGMGSSVPSLVQAGADIFLEDQLGMRPIQAVTVLLNSRSWRKGEATALSVGRGVLHNAEKAKADAARADAAARELLAEEDRRSGGHGRHGSRRKA